MRGCPAHDMPQRAAAAALPAAAFVTCSIAAQRCAWHLQRCREQLRPCQASPVLAPLTSGLAPENTFPLTARW